MGAKRALTVHKDGERIVIGEVDVDVEGNVKATIYKDSPKIDLKRDTIYYSSFEDAN